MGLIFKTVSDPNGIDSDSNYYLFKQPLRMAQLNHGELSHHSSVFML